MKDRFASSSRRMVAILGVVTIAGILFLLFTIPGSQYKDLRFNPFALISGVSALVNVGLFLYLTKKAVRSEEHLWLTVFVSICAVYSIAETLQRLSITPGGASIWSNLEGIGVLIAPALYLFALAYTNKSPRRYPGLTSFVLLCAILIFFFELASSVVIITNSTAVYRHFPWGYMAVNNAASGEIFFALFTELIFILSFARLVSFRRHTRNPILRKQSLLFIFATALPAFVAIATDGLLPALGVPVLPMAGTLAAVAALMLIYGAVRYQVLTISPALFSETILGIMHEAVVVTDAQFGLLYANSRTESLLGLKADSSKHINFLSSVIESDQASFRDAFAQGGTGSDVTMGHITLVLHGATATIPVRVTASRLLVGNQENWVMILADITAELHTRNIIEHEVRVRTSQLHEAQASLVASINSLEQGFILVGQHMQVKLTNGEANKLFNAAGRDTADMQLAEFIRPVPLNFDIAEATGRVLAGHHFRPRVATSEGSFFQIFITPVEGKRRSHGAAIIIEDITEEKILNRSKDEFFSIASHELRTPLTAIKGNMSMVRDYFPEAMKDESLAAMVNDAHDASERLISIVNDFLDSSKLEQGKMMFNIQPLEVRPLIDAVCGDLQPLFTEHQIKLSLVGLEQLPKVAADDVRFRQILGNLLSNAVKYSDNGATITISAQKAGNMLRIRVSDTGKGISPESQKLLFHKFQQAGESILTRDDTKGTGLGLYISRLLAKNMRGNVELEHSEVGKGTTFALDLPLTNVLGAHDGKKMVLSGITKDGA